ncbi:MAG: alpha/beta fold hydrolase [Wenzhouxiangella sp.]|nr:MAG: alpha/beta fold hydrolase [Wenzhouxiangella sp.]
MPVVADDGHRFDLIRVPAEDPTGRFLFLPGMGMTARQYIPHAQALANHGIEVFIHEWRGLGSSNVRAGRASNWGYHELLELDLTAAVDALGNAAGEQKLILGGHSLGSQFACLLAACRPTQTAGVVIIAGGAPYWRSFPHRHRWALRAVFSIMPVVAAMVGHYPGRQLGFAGREARNVIGDWCRTGRTGLYAAPGIELDLEAGMTGLDIPVLGLRMAGDWFVPPASLDYLLDKLPGCKCQTVTIRPEHPDDKADHYSWMKVTGPTARAIADWHQSMAATSRA